MSNPPILLVEDDPNDVFFFEHAMKKAGFIHPLQIARDGGEAIDYFSGDGAFTDRDQFPLPCLVVLDLNLPRLHGLEVLQWIRKSAPDRNVPVIVLSSSTSDRDICDAYRLGANSFLNKPTKSADLVALLCALEMYWFRLNRLPATRRPNDL